MIDRKPTVSPLRFVVLGAGRVTREVHLRALSRLRGVVVDAIADPDPAALRDAARWFPAARQTADWRDALGHPCDAVLVALPGQFHEPAALLALAEGRHVYLEKPPALDRHGALRIAAAARATGAVCQIGFHLRFDPRIEAMRSALRAGHIGRLLQARTFFGIPARNVPAWKQAPPAGGALLDLATHHLDILRFLSGTNPRVLEASISDAPFHEASTRIVLSVEGGATAEIVCTLDGPASQTLMLSGSGGSILLDRYRDWWPQFAEVPGVSGGMARPHRVARASAAIRYAVSKIGAPWSDPSFLAAWRHFVLNVRLAISGRQLARECAASADDGAEALRLVEQARRTAAPST